MTILPNMHLAADWYVSRMRWYVHPLHTPIFHGAECVGCTCEFYRRSAECAEKHPHLYLGPTGKCPNPGKCPRLAWGSKSTLDREQVRRWWSWPWPNIDVETGKQVRLYPNIGIDCGRSDLFVFDLDTYKDVFGGIGNLLRDEDQETVTAISGGGGGHLFYNRQGRPYGNSTKGLPAGIDFRGAGGYVVAAPSRHKSGQLYRYEIGYEPTRIPLLPIPASLDKILSATVASNDFSGGGYVPDAEAVRRSVALVEDLIASCNLRTTPAKQHGDGVKWVIKCPFNPKGNEHADDGSAFIVIEGDGKIRAGCHHQRCRKVIEGHMGGSAWHLLKFLSGYSTRTQDVFGGVL